MVIRGCFFEQPIALSPMDYLLTGFDSRSMYERSILPSPDRDRHLETVTADLGGSLRAAEAHEPTDELLVREVTFQRLWRWANDAGVCYPGLEPLEHGGREHDLTFDADSQTWLKFTKSSNAGFHIEFDPDRARFTVSPGLPLAYLERLLIQNQLFGDLTTFVGVGGTLHRPRIITRQRRVVGDGAPEEEIIHLMVDILGFAPLPKHLSVGYQNALAFIRDDFAVFDLRPANVVKTDAGLLVAIDVIPVRVDEAMRERFGGLLRASA